MMEIPVIGMFQNFNVHILPLEFQNTYMQTAL